MVSNLKASQPHWRRRLLLAVGILAGLAVAAIIRGSWGGQSDPEPDPVHQAAWDKIAPRLSSAERASVHAGGKYGERVRAFFAERKQAAKPFAEEALSLSGKWAFVKSKLPWTDAD